MNLRRNKWFMGEVIFDTERSKKGTIRGLCSVQGCMLLIRNGMAQWSQMCRSIQKTKNKMTFKVFRVAYRF
jgi:hypothetical protein